MNLETLKRYGRIAGTVIGAITLAYLLIVPFLPSTENARLFSLTLMLTSIGVAISWNLTGGFTGYVDFGHAVWFGIGAYGTAVMMSMQSSLVPGEFPLIPSILVGALLAALIANLLGRMTMKLSGPYFSIAMLGFFVFTREVVRVWRPLTNGGVGLTLPPSINRPLWYWVQLVLVVALLAVSWWLRRTRFGSSLIAIREDEIGAEMRGINTTRSKVMIFTFSGFCTGLFGGMWAYQNTFVDPDIAFAEVRTIDAVMGTMLGGIGSVLGPVVGSTVLYWLREILWANLLDFHLIAQGLLLGLIVLYLPKGLMGLTRPDSPIVRRLMASGDDAEHASTFDGMESAMNGTADPSDETVSVGGDSGVTGGSAEVLNPEGIVK